MKKSKLMEDLFNKIPENSRVMIFGACDAGKLILEDILKFKPSVKVVGFVDNFFSGGGYCNAPVYRLREAVDLKSEYDLVIMSTRVDQGEITNIFDIYDIPVIRQTKFVYEYYRKNVEILSDENCEKVVSIFDNEEDKDLYTMLFDARIGLREIEDVKNYFYNNVTKYRISLTIKKHYLDKINTEAVRTFLDAGMYDGLNIIAYHRFLPNLEKIYGFEVLYDEVRKSYIEDFIFDDRLEIVPKLLGEKSEKVEFNINKKYYSASFAEEVANKSCKTDSPEWERKVFDMTTIDEFSREHGVRPDFIKMDIEGAELPALKGGIKTIRECRPQLAISIYHSHKDFVTIPVYLKENLEGYRFRLGHYSSGITETVLYAIPEELRG